MKRIEITLPDTQGRAYLREDYTWDVPGRRDLGLLERRLNRDFSRSYLPLYANAAEAAEALGGKVVAAPPEDDQEELIDGMPPIH